MVIMVRVFFNNLQLWCERKLFEKIRKLYKIVIYNCIEELHSSTIFEQLHAREWHHLISMCNTFNVYPYSTHILLFIYNSFIPTVKTLEMLFFYLSYRVWNQIFFDKLLVSNRITSNAERNLVSEKRENKKFHEPLSNCCKSKTQFFLKAKLNFFQDSPEFSLSLSLVSFLSHRWQKLCARFLDDLRTSMRDSGIGT